MANVRFENITVGYGDHMVLKDFSLEVQSGQIVCRLSARITIPL